MMTITKKLIAESEQEIQSTGVGFVHLLAAFKGLEQRVAAIEARFQKPPVVTALTTETATKNPADTDTVTV